jgi:hypothetical protein
MLFIELLATVQFKNGQQFKQGTCVWAYVHKGEAVLAYPAKTGGRHIVELTRDQYRVMMADPDYGDHFPSPEIRRPAKYSEGGGE